MTGVVDADLVEGIIAMPDKLFYSTGIPVSLWIITKNKKQSGKTLSIDARDMGTWCPAGSASLPMRTSPRYRLRLTRSVTALWKRRRLLRHRHDGRYQAQDYILTPGRYVGVAEVEEDDEPFEEKMTRLTGEIAKCFEESNRLQEQIKKNLEAIGYGM